MSAPRPVPMSETECRRHLQYEAFVGRVAFAREGVVEIRPVNYLADEGGVTFCTERGSIYEAVLGGTPLTFEVDGSRPLDHSGWSVVARGSAREITDAEELALLRRGPLRSWAVAANQQWIRLDVTAISGVRIPAH